MRRRRLWQRHPPLVALAVVGMLAATAGAGAATSPPGARTSASSATPIRHVVVIMQENHSFDSVLGAFCAEVAAGQIVRPGANSPCDGATTGELQSGKIVQLAAAPDVVPNSDHNVAAQTRDIAGGAMDGFNTNEYCTGSNYVNCYSQYDPLSGTCPAGVSSHGSCIPSLAALAQKYTVGDRFFELYDAPSWGGHLYTATANLDGFTGDNPKNPGSGPQPVALGPGWGCDSGRLGTYQPPTDAPTVSVPSCVADQSGSLGPNWSGYTGTRATYIPTIFDRLDAAHLSWRLYAGAGKPDQSTQGFQESGWQWAICPTFAECLYGPQKSDVAPASQIISDAGSLPAFSIVTPTITDSQHNDSSMLTGDNYVNTIVSAIQSGPDWASTAIFITYDDCGCFYDHVTPVNGWGVRVPLVVVSPYAKAGYTDSHPTTVAGILHFAENTFGLPPLNATDRDAYGLADSFCFRSGCTAAGTAPVRVPERAVTAMTPAQRAAQVLAGQEDT